MFISESFHCLQIISVPLWYSMIKNSSASDQKEKSKCVIFVIDASNSPAFLAETAVHFIEVLNYLKSTKKPGRVLIVYSKIDIIPKDSSAKVITNIKQLLRINHIKHWYAKEITIREVEYSAVTGQGIDKIRYWLNHCYLY